MDNALNLPEINQEQALHLGKFFMRSGQNLFLFGRRGIGKSFIALQAAQQCKFKVQYINLSVIERSDIAGFPNIHEQGDVITYKSPIYLPKLLNKAKPDSVLLFDEVDKAPLEVVSPLLEILQFRKINGTPLNVQSCILTGNLISEGAHSNHISSALLDRGAKYVLSFDFDQWLQWGKTNGIHDLILGFLKSHPELACGKIEDQTYASPSPRGWTLASEAMVKARQLKMVDTETIVHIISGYVGVEAGIKFKTWYEHYRQFEPFIHSLIDKGLTSFDFASLFPTEKIIFVIAACHYAKQRVLAEPVKNKDRLVFLEHLCRFLRDYKVEPEMQVIGLHNGFSFESITAHKLYECKAFFDLFNELSQGLPVAKK
jgi:hypothetical protein